MKPKRTADLSLFLTITGLLLASLAPTSRLSAQSKSDKRDEARMRQFVDSLFRLDRWDRVPMASWNSMHLVDVNDDGYQDIVLPWRPGNCSGANYGVDLYLWDTARHDFIEFKQMELTNASFDLKKQTVTTFVENCDGTQFDDAFKLKWQGLKLDTLEGITAFCPEGKKCETRKHDYVTGRITKTKTEFGLPDYYFKGLFVGAP